MTYASSSIALITNPAASGATGHIGDHNEMLAVINAHDSVLSSAGLLFSSSALLGSSSTTFSASSLAALINDETGSGSLVFNTSPNFVGTISGSNVTLTGELTASVGTTTLNTLLATSASLGVSGSIAGIIVSSSHVEFADPFLYIGTSNASAYDVGFYGHTNNPSYNHFGLARFANDNVWKFFSNFTEPPENSASAQVASANYDIVRMGGLQIYSGSATQSASISSGGQLLLGAGTATVAPLTLISGTNLTTPAAGAIEYDGKVAYITTNTAASSRGVVPNLIFVTTSADRSLNAASTAQAIFASTNDIVTLAASTSYLVDMFFTMYNTATSSVSYTENLIFSTTGTPTYSFYVNYTGARANPTNNGQTTYTAWTTASSTTLGPPGGSSSGVHSAAIGVRGIIRTTTSATFSPQIAFSAVPNPSSASILANAYMSVAPIGSNTVVALPAWT